MRLDGDCAHRITNSFFGDREPSWAGS
jgi:hypothetical protein